MTAAANVGLGVTIKADGCDVQIILRVETAEEAAAMAHSMLAHMQGGKSLTLVLERINHREPLN